MELILISDSKLKIMLTLDDLRLYSLDCNSLDYENTETRRAFWSILDEAKHRTGFDAASEKVFVQVYPSKTGGCEMYVTKLGAFKDEEDGSEDDVIINPPLGARKGEGIIRKESRVPLGLGTPDIFKGRREIFRFDDIGLLIKACRRLRDSGYFGESSAYTGEGGAYLSLSGEILALRDEIRSFVLEYSDRIECSSFDVYISEHGRCICRADAVRTLGEF